MASSSIEVLGLGGGGNGGDLNVMVVESGEGMEGEEEEMETVITADDGEAEEGSLHLMTAAAQEPETEEAFTTPTTEAPPDGLQMEEEEDEEGDEFTTLESMKPPPGTIIFSPQDLLRPSRPSYRGRGRGIQVKEERPTPTYGASGDLEVPVSCEVCGKVMMTGKTLVQHMAIHSDLKPFQCPHCPKSFARKVHLQGHLVVHGIEKQFECPICHQRFSRQDCVKVHMRLHDKSKCVFCDVCHKAFLTVGALNIHLRIHRGEKPFKCHLCSKCFTQKNHLITHIKRHTKVTDDHFTKKLGPRMFKCEHCPRSFIRLSDYERHVQWNHGAVADGSIVEKLPTVGTIVSGEHKQTGLTPQVFKAPKDALNSKPRQRRPKKIMCTTATQTDDEGGRIIIPRQYQVSAATQVSAPPTPRHDEDFDIFDEGMDRNYSSEEDEDLEERGAEREDPLEQKVFSIPQTTDTPSNPSQDAAFDAIVQGKPVSEERRSVTESTDRSDFLDQVAQRIENEAAKSDPKPEERKQDHDKSLESEIEIRSVPPPKVKLQPTSSRAPTRQVVALKDGTVKVKKEPVGVLPIKLINPPKRGRGRGRGRGRKWSPFGLSGAAELRAIRMNMMKNILSYPEMEAKEVRRMLEDEEEEPAEFEEQEAEEVNPLEVEEEKEGRSKRQAKNKQHGKDFVCNMKSCEICFPPSNTPAKPPKPSPPKPKPKLEKPEKKPASVASSVASKQADSVHGLLSLARSIPVATKTVKIPTQQVVEASEKDESKVKVVNRVGTYPVDITANPIQTAKTGTLQPRREDYFVTSTTGASVVSPPVELMSCIPTYSCKLCSREFRFEGKLHRHIESVHQNKAIFSPDVKPGRGSTKPGTILPQSVVGQSVRLDENPEIAALRSEWDDDENEETITGEVLEPIHRPIPIVTKDIAPVTTTVTDVYSSGVKVNMNKLAGLLPQMDKSNAREGQPQIRTEPRTPGTPTNQPTPQPQEPETITADTLDMKCRRLLEKLFDHTLLLQCGLLEEHVSVVLGKVLQHYGVKMIEDYGQGQYEVLKYNLWRLIEWKVTMEQMEEFYTEGKSVEEMMDDIMHDHVPIITHHYVPPEPAQSQPQSATTTRDPIDTGAPIQTVEVSDGQMVLQNILGGQINLPEGVTQVVLSQDVTPELLQGAHIVTIDPTTGQVISQVTADQVILADAIGDELESQVSALDGQVVVSQGQIGEVIQTSTASTTSESGNV